MKEVYFESKAEPLNESGTQKWISAHKHIPFTGVDNKGDFAGRYLCVVERPMSPDSFDYIKGGISRTVEMCYYNDLTKLWMDNDREWVKVTHWTQIPDLPFHNSRLIAREEMLLRIDSGELKLVREGKETDEFYEIDRRFALSSISYDTTTYFSSTREMIDDKRVEDYMYAAQNI
jgi:hypothetical protein